MFQSISRGFGFLGQAIDMARKDGDLIKPSLYGLVVGALVSAVGAVPVIAVALLGGGTDLGNFVLYVLGAILIFAQYAIAYIFSATYFILPIMVIEDLSLFPAARRATDVVRKNLLLVAVTEIGVSGVVGLIGFLLALVALAIGGGIFFAFSALGQIGLIVGAGLAVLVAGTLIALISAFSSYVTTAYHTCMFLWARDAERAIAAGESVQSVRAPAPVAAVLTG